MEQQLKTLMYGWEFPPKISGGLGVACYAIVKELLQQGIDLTLVLPFSLKTSDLTAAHFKSTADLLPFAKNQEQLKLHYCPAQAQLNPYAQASQLAPLNNNAIDSFKKCAHQLHHRAIKKLAIHWLLNQQEFLTSGGLVAAVIKYASEAGKLACQTEHDVIHAHDWLTVLAALEAKSYSGKPVVLHMHALETDRSGGTGDERIFAIEKLGMELVDRIIAVSQFTKDNIIKHYGIPADKITVVHNGVYIEEDSTEIIKRDPSKPPTVLFLGRITQQKGPYFFIETAKKILAVRPDVQFVLAGVGDLLPSMIEHVASLRIGRNVHFTGFLNHEQVKNIYQLADVYVMPSTSEPFGLSALEAVSFGVPTVISRQSGVAEVLKHALVADFWDIEAMAAKILALLHYRTMHQTFAQQARQELQYLTWENAAQKIVQVYREISLGEQI